MKVIGIFLIAILLSSASLAFAHPYVDTLAVIDPDGKIVFESDNLVSKKTVSESIEWFTQEWFDYNLIWILVSVITVTMTITVLITYREEIIPKITR